jgi:thymidylate kinase
MTNQFVEIQSAHESRFYSMNIRKVSLLTSSKRVLHEKLIIPHLTKKVYSICENDRFVISAACYPETSETSTHSP